MSYVPTGAIFVAIAAKKAREKQEKEEENMAKYKSDDLDGWEFKIVRSSTGKFKNSEFINQTLIEEALSGWEMLEKFDNNRIRFKRRIENRSRDQHVEADAYRTNIVVNTAKIAAILGIIMILLGSIAFLIFAIDFNMEIVDSQKLILSLVAVLGVILAVIVIKKAHS